MDDEREEYIKDGYKANKILSIKGKSEWRHWVHIRAAEHTMSTAEFIAFVLEDYARRNNKPLPPERI